jgi:hypothetical protein
MRGWNKFETGFAAFAQTTSVSECRRSFRATPAPYEHRLRQMNVRTMLPTLLRLRHYRTGAAAVAEDAALSAAAQRLHLKKRLEALLHREINLSVLTAASFCARLGHLHSR